MRPHLRLGVAVESATWDDDRHVWTVRLDDGTTDECHVLISGVGFLNVPRYPDWPGLDDFEGPKFHTSRWEHHHDLTDKVVAVVGTGSTATQIVPAIQPDRASTCTCSSASRAGSCPRANATSRAEERRTFSNPWRRRQERLRLKWLLEKNIWGGKIFRRRHEAERGPHASSASTTSPRASRTAPTCARPSPRRYPYPGKRPIFAIDVLPRAQGAQRRAGPEGGRVGDPHRHRRRRRRRARRSTCS